MCNLSVLVKKNMIILYLILLAAALVRIIGIDWYLPYTYELDEYYTIRKALGFLKQGTLNPGSFLWPTLYMYIQALSYGFYYLWRLLGGSVYYLSNLTQKEIFLVGRFTTALFGIGTVLLVYLIGERMYSKKVGLLSSLFLAFTLLHIKYSRLIRPDVPMTFFIIFSFLCIYLVYESGKTRYYILAAIFAGFSIATKYTGGVLVIPILLAHLLRGIEEKKTWPRILLDKKVFLAFLFVVVGFFVGCPYGFVYFSNLLRTMSMWTSRGLDRITINQPGEVRGWFYYITGALHRGMGQPLEIFSLTAVVYAMFRHRKKDILLVSFPLVYYLIMGKFLRHHDRYILPIVPFLTIAAAMFVVEIASKISQSKLRQNFILVGLAIAIILFPSIRVIRYVDLTTKKGTGLEAKEWIEENIPHKSRIAYEIYCPPISGYDLRNMSRIGYHPLSWYKKARFDYLILSSFSYGRYFDTPLKGYEGIKHNYEEIEAKCELTKQFDPPNSLSASLNPTIKVYKINYEYPYVEFPFPMDLEEYSQLISIERKSGGWMLWSRVTYGSRIGIEEHVKNPYVRLVNPEGPEIAKLIIHEGPIAENRALTTAENSVFLPFLPGHYHIYIGYEYDSSQSQNSSGEVSFKEVKLDFSDRLASPLENFNLNFIYGKIPSIHAAEYGQMVAILKTKDEVILWSRIFGGELTFGDDYVLNPYVRLFDSEKREIAKLLIYKGKVGSEGSVAGPEENSLILSSLPSSYTVCIGYEFYHDDSHEEIADGPLEIELGEISEE